MDRRLVPQHQLPSGQERDLEREVCRSDSQRRTQLDPFPDCANNVKLCPAFHEYFRKWMPPLLVIWGKNDPYFIPAGAEAFRRDDPNATVQFLDTGHFALETHVDETASAVRQFLAKFPQ